MWGGGCRLVCVCLFDRVVIKVLSAVSDLSCTGNARRTNAPCMLDEESSQVLFCFQTGIEWKSMLLINCDGGDEVTTLLRFSIGVSSISQQAVCSH